MNDLSFDESYDVEGRPRPHWKEFSDAFSSLDQTAARLRVTMDPIPTQRVQRFDFFGNGYVCDEILHPRGGTEFAAEFTFRSPPVPSIPEAFRFARDLFGQNRPVSASAMG